MANEKYIYNHSSYRSYPKDVMKLQVKYDIGDIISFQIEKQIDNICPACLGAKKIINDNGLVEDCSECIEHPGEGSGTKTITETKCGRVENFQVVYKMLSNPPIQVRQYFLELKIGKYNAFTKQFIVTDSQTQRFEYSDLKAITLLNPECELKNASFNVDDIVPQYSLLPTKDYWSVAGIASHEVARTPVNDANRYGFILSLPFARNIQIKYYDFNDDSQLSSEIESLPCPKCNGDGIINNLNFEQIDCQNLKHECDSGWAQYRKIAEWRTSYLTELEFFYDRKSMYITAPHILLRFSVTGSSELKEIEYRQFTELDFVTDAHGIQLTGDFNVQACYTRLNNSFLYRILGYSNRINNVETPMNITEFNLNYIHDDEIQFQDQEENIWKLKNEVVQLIDGSSHSVITLTQDNYKWYLFQGTVNHVSYYYIEAPDTVGRMIHQQSASSNNNTWDKINANDLSNIESGSIQPWALLKNIFK